MVESVPSSQSSFAAYHPPETTTRKVAQAYVDRFMGHAYAFVDGLSRQNAPIDIQLASIYQTAQQELHILNKQLKVQVEKGKGEHLSAKEIKALGKSLAAAKKQIVSTIQKTQLEVLKEISKAQGDDKRVQHYVALLAKADWRASLIKLLAKVIKTETVFKKALNSYKAAINLMIQQSKATLTEKERISLEKTEIGRDKLAEFEQFQADHSTLDRRLGALVLGSFSRLRVEFSKKEIAKQYESFKAQYLSETERIATDYPIHLLHPQTKQPVVLTSKMIPLNAQFDQFLEEKGMVTQLFKTLFGKQGISSTNRLEKHLVNGWFTTLNHLNQERPFYRAFRHAILSDKYERDPATRQANSRQAARELLTAALLQELTDRGLSLERAAEARKPIEFHFNSVSLVTPDSIRGIGKHGADEKTMLRDQIEALHSFENQEDQLQALTIDGHTIPINVHVNTFNFGVNAGAMGRKFLGLKFGLDTQFKSNKMALKGLNQQIHTFLQLAKTPAMKAQKADLANLVETIKRLQKDIHLMMTDKEAYLRGNNQYEIGAKIILLSNKLDTGYKLAGKPGVHCAYNCMSGKDRTGVMDDMAKALAILEEITHTIPTHDEFINDLELQKQFREILIHVMLESGNLEITEINAGVIGYKVKEEARLFGISIEEFLSLQGLGKTTPSF